MPLPPQAGAPGSTAASAAEQVAIVAQQLRGGAINHTCRLVVTSFEKQIGGVSFLGRPFNDLHEYWADPNSPFEIKGECGRVSCTVVGERVLSSFDSGFTSL